MSRRDAASEMVGVQVIALEEASNLGVVDEVLIDEKTRKLSAISFRSRKTGKQAYIESTSIERIGHDVMLVVGESVVRDEPPLDDLGRPLKKIRGMRVTTRAGKFLGKLEDVDIDGDTRLLSDLHLDHDRNLPVKPADVVIGDDEIIVPGDYVDRIVEEPGRGGLFQRFSRWTRGLGSTNARPPTTH